MGGVSIVDTCRKEEDRREIEEGERSPEGSGEKRTKRREWLTGAHVEGYLQNGWTALHWASLKDRLNVAKLLLEEEGGVDLARMQDSMVSVRLCVLGQFVKKGKGEGER